MSNQTRELLERAREAGKLEGSASRRIADAVFRKLARGVSALPGIDVPPAAYAAIGCSFEPLD